MYHGESDNKDKSRSQEPSLLRISDNLIPNSGSQCTNPNHADRTSGNGVRKGGGNGWQETHNTKGNAEDLDHGKVPSQFLLVTKLCWISIGSAMLLDSDSESIGLPRTAASPSLARS